MTVLALGRLWSGKAEPVAAAALPFDLDLGVRAGIIVQIEVCGYQLAHQRLLGLNRSIGVNDPESALREANRKFYRRFHYIEEALAAQGKSETTYPLSVLDALWNEAKEKGL